jgi:hypothetical protein
MLVSTSVAIIPGPDDKVFTPSLPLNSVEVAKKTEEDKQDKLVLRWLAGFHEDEKGRPITSYLGRNSPEECKARTVLARQLRANTLSGLAREILALAIDPETPSERGIPAVWKIEFTSPARGGKSTWARDRLIVAFIRQWLRENPDESEEAAVGAAEDAFGLGRSRIAEIWQRYKEGRAREAALPLITLARHLLYLLKGRIQSLAERGPN